MDIVEMIFFHPKNNKNSVNKPDLISNSKRNAIYIFNYTKSLLER